VPVAEATANRDFSACKCNDYRRDNASSALFFFCLNSILKSKDFILETSKRASNAIHAALYVVKTYWIDGVLI